MKKATSAGGIVIQGNAILFVVFPNEKLSFPKGTPEEGETLEQTAVREVAEETGLKNPRIVKYLGIVTRMGTMNDLPVMKDIHLYLMKVANYTQGVADEETEWLTFDAARPRLFPEEEKFLVNIFPQLGL